MKKGRFTEAQIIVVLRESFNGRLRDECLNEEVFASLAEARTVIERWRLHYNLVRPHSAHGGLTPDAVRQDPAAGRLRHPNRSADRPLPPDRDPLSPPRALTMIEGPEGGRSQPDKEGGAGCQD